MARLLLHSKAASLIDVISHLHKQTLDLPLCHYVIFSSVSGD
jgi:hypothetical protein